MCRKWCGFLGVISIIHTRFNLKFGSVSYGSITISLATVDNLICPLLLLRCRWECCCSEPYNSCVTADDTFIEVDDNAITPEHLQTKWWIKELHLAISDRNALLSGGELTDSINASQWLLAHQYPRVKGFQDTFHSQLLSFSSA